MGFCLTRRAGLNHLPRDTLGWFKMVILILPKSVNNSNIIYIDTNLMNIHSDAFNHILFYIAQEQTSYNSRATKCNTHEKYDPKPAHIRVR